MDYSVTVWRCPKGHEVEVPSNEVNNVYCDKCSQAFGISNVYRVEQGHFITNIRKSVEPKHFASDGLHRDPLLVEREKTHGSFADNARYAQMLRTFWRQSPAWNMMNDTQREALDAKALKLSRILSGQPHFKDHWDDDAGYSKLASEACDA